MREQRRVLFVTICSNNKKGGGRAGYDASKSLTTRVGGQVAAEILHGRARVFELIRKGGKTRGGIRISELFGNHALVKGPDLGGAEPDGRYLPAAHRYTGSFFTQLGPDATSLLSSGPASVVVLSGLYGTILAGEPIQDYSCHLNDHPAIRTVWAGSGLATDAVIGLVKSLGVEKVLDFTALHSYRYLLDWDSIRKSAPGGVLHLFGERTTGNSLLTPLGALARNLLSAQTEEELLCLQNGQFLQTETERIYCHSGDRPPRELPDELRDEVVLFDACDEVVRMAREVRKRLYALDPTFEDKGIPGRIDRLVTERRISGEVAEAMKDIVRWRNQVEYQYTFTALQIPIDWLRARYEVATGQSGRA